jgi:ketosteroid isomerase-like protein
MLSPFPLGPALPGAREISADQVRAAVISFWKVLVEKSFGKMEEFYTEDSIVFSPFVQRAEMGRLSADRREQEYFSRHTSFRAELGTIDVLLLADDIAVAAYTFNWYASGVVDKTTGQKYDKAVRSGRGTQVFKIDHDGELRIVHEHFSDIWRDSGEAQVRQ